MTGESGCGLRGKEGLSGSDGRVRIPIAEPGLDDPATRNDPEELPAESPAQRTTSMPISVSRWSSTTR